MHSPNVVYFSVFVLLSITRLSVEEDTAKEVIIGAVFGDPKGGEAAAFKLAVQKINTNRILLPNVAFVPLLLPEASKDTFSDIEQVLEVLRQGASTVVGPLSGMSVRISQAMAAHALVPQLAPTAESSVFVESPLNFKFLLRMSPNTLDRLRVAVDFIKHHNWTKFSVLTSMSDGVNSMGMDGLYVLQQAAKQHKWQLHNIEHFHVHDDPTLTNATKQLLRIKDKQSRIVILKCPLKYVTMVMKQAEQMDMIQDWVWILTNLDQDMDSLFPRDQPVPSYLRGSVGIQESIGHGVLYNNFKLAWSQTGQRHRITPSVAHTYDSVMILATAMHRMIEDGHNVPSRTASNESAPWQQGNVLLKYIKEARTEGVMSQLSFTEDGSPSQVFFDLINLQRDGAVQVGSWGVGEGLRMERVVVWSDGQTDPPQDSPNYLMNKHIKVVTYLLEPFVMVDETGKFHGMCVDLLNEIQAKLGFTYELYLSPTGDIGEPVEQTGQWSGIVGQLISKEAELAIGAITISPERQEVMDYTQPFMNFGLKILMSSAPPTEKLSSYFRFLSPFTFSLWLTILATVIIMGVVNWLFSVLSPYGFYGRVAQAIDKSEVKPTHVKTMNDLNVWNSIWASVAYYLSQGPDGLHPVSASGRCAVGAWWFGITILGATYTANMAAYFTVSRLTTPIAGVDDLSKQTDIPYGTTAQGQPRHFFEMSTIPRYTMMWHFMSHYNTLINSTEEAYNRVKNDNFAFIYDGPVLEYVQRNYCKDFLLVGRAFGNLGYGFALPRGSPFTQSLNVQILRLLNSGKIDQIKERWFVGPSHCDLKNTDQAGSSEENSLDNDQLDIENMLGVFLLMFAGIVFGFLALIGEWIYAVRNDCRKDKSLSVCSAVARRIKLVCKSLCVKSHKRDRAMYTMREPMLSPFGSSTPDAKVTVCTPDQKPPGAKKNRGATVRWKHDQASIKLSDSNESMEL